MISYSVFLYNITNRMQCKTIAVGLLDRVVHGVTAVEMMKACDEAAHKILIEENPTNPQISISQVRPCE